jgi:hypothetical protein
MPLPPSATPVEAPDDVLAILARARIRVFARPDLGLELIRPARKDEKTPPWFRRRFGRRLRTGTPRGRLLCHM